MQTLREKKVMLIDILSADPSWILQYVQQENLITKREYNKFNHDNHTTEKIAMNLIDAVMHKGDEMCNKFVALLQQEEVQENFPMLKSIFTSASTSHNQDNPVRAAGEITEYRMSSIPRGLCVIINNVDFTRHGTRSGSDSDADSLKKVFHWLGFNLDEHKNQTTSQMKELLQNYSQKQHNGDCFVCCILSHGSADGVYGTDGSTISIDDIIRPFSGQSCPSLANKPKVFFIQACRGKTFHQSVAVQSDNNEETEAEVEGDTLEMDAVPISLPDKSDFLVARSTIKGYVSFRNSVSGSWFIQSLCEQLKTHCPEDQDILTILQCVNKEVSEKATVHRCLGVLKQMPEFSVTLRHKLVFHVAHQ